MDFLIFCLHGIEMLVSGLTLNQYVFQFLLVACFSCFVGTGSNDIFQLKVQSLVFTKSLFRLEAETLALFTTGKREVSSTNNLTSLVRPRGRSLM